MLIYKFYKWTLGVNSKRGILLRSSQESLLPQCIGVDQDKIGSIKLSAFFSLTGRCSHQYQWISPCKRTLRHLAGILVLRDLHVYS